MIAEIYWLTAEEGGRKIPLMPSRLRRFGTGRPAYWANTQTKGVGIWSVGVYFDTEDDVKLGTSGKYEIAFLTPEGAGQFNSGDPLYICEGSKVVGRGIIL